MTYAEQHKERYHSDPEYRENFLKHRREVWKKNYYTNKKFREKEKARKLAWLHKHKKQGN